jgi:hypothetical protein
MKFLKRIFGRRDVVPEPEEADDPHLINAYATVRDLPPLDFPHDPRGARDLSDPAFAPHLAGFIGYIMNRGDGQMTAARYHLWRHVQRVRHNVSFEVDTADVPDVETWACAANAVLFLADGSVRAPDLAVLLSADGESDPDAVLPYPPDAVARRARTLARLDGIEPAPPASMPPAIGEAEVVLRSPVDTLRRALALLYVAAEGQRFSTGVALILGDPEENPTGFASLTPREKDFLESGAQDQAVARAMTWRYEAANTLLWALGIDAARIAESDRLIDVDALGESVADLARPGAAMDGLGLRPVGEILDALDCTWREHWIVRQATAKGLPLSALNGDVVAERHIALNWLTGFHNDHGTAWDDVDIPT